MKISVSSISPIIAALLFATAAVAQDKVPLKTQLPKPLFVGTPVPLNVPNLEPPLKGKRADFMVPAGTVNLAKGKKVTASDENPVTGTLDLVTDGDKAGDEGSWVELGPGKQWVQIDLAKSANIYAVLVWHFHSQARVYRDVVAQVSDDPNFKSGVTTIFNNDFKNEVGAGADGIDGNIRRQVAQEIREVVLVLRHEEHLRRTAGSEPGELAERLVGEQPSAQLRHARAQVGRDVGEGHRFTCL